MNTITPFPWGYTIDPSKIKIYLLVNNDDAIFIFLSELAILFRDIRYYILHVQFNKCLFICLFVRLFVFVALRPKSTAMVIAGRSVHLTTLFPGQA